MGKRKAASVASAYVGDDPSRNAEIRDIVTEANALQPQDFRDHYWDFDTWDAKDPAIIALSNVKELDDTDIKECFSLIEQTSRHDYEPSSFGWHPRLKMREMKQKEMWYMRAANVNTGDFLGFLSFMITNDSTPAVPVLYIYEVHLTKKARGQGLGKWLIYAVEDVAQRVGVDKVMLTCFKSNFNAFNLYKYLDYARDVSSPEDRRTRNKVVKMDYIIMSKKVDKEASRSTASAKGKARGGNNAVSGCVLDSHEQLTDAPRLSNFNQSLPGENESVFHSWAFDDIRRPNDELLAASCARHFYERGVDMTEAVLGSFEAAELLDAGPSTELEALRSAKDLSTIVRGFAARFDEAKELCFLFWKYMDPLRSELLALPRFSDDPVLQFPTGLAGIDLFFTHMPETMKVALLDAVKLNRGDGHELVEREQEVTLREVDVLRRERELEDRAADLSSRSAILKEREKASGKATKLVQKREESAQKQEDHSLIRVAEMRSQWSNMVSAYLENSNERDRIKADLFETLKRAVDTAASGDPTLQPRGGDEVKGLRAEEVWEAEDLVRQGFTTKEIRKIITRRLRDRNGVSRPEHNDEETDEEDIKEESEDNEAPFVVAGDEFIEDPEGNYEDDCKDEHEDEELSKDMDDVEEGGDDSGAVENDIENEHYRHAYIRTNPFSFHCFFPIRDLCTTFTAHHILRRTTSLLPFPPAH